MYRPRSLFLLIVVLVIVCANFAWAQQRGGLEGMKRDLDLGTAQHTLYGDFKVDSSKASGSKSTTFQVVLYNQQGQPFGRQSITPNGRYFFNNINNGEYQLVIEMEGAEISRQPVRVFSIYRNEFKHDVELEWRENAVTAKANTGIVSAADAYARSSANQKLFEKVQDSIAKKDQKQAVTLLGQIVNADAQDYQAWVTLGLLYFVQEKHGDAEKAFRSALTAKGDFKPALLNLGKAQMAQKSFDLAIETLTKAVEADPKSAEANYLLGESYLQIKKGSKAVGYLNEAIKLDPIGMADAHLRLGMLYRGAGLKEKAVAEFEQFLAKRPDSPEKEKIQQYITENKPR